MAPCSKHLPVSVEEEGARSRGGRAMCVNEAVASAPVSVVVSGYKTVPVIRRRSLTR